MKIPEKISSFFKRRRSKIEVKNTSDGSTFITDYKIQEFFDQDNAFEKLFKEYKSFDITQNNITYHLVIYFTSDITQKQREEIFNFAEDGFIKKVDPLMIFLNIGIIYNLVVSHKGVPAENKLKLFIGNVNM